MRENQIILCQYPVDNVPRRSDILLPGPPARDIVAYILAQLTPRLVTFGENARLATGLFMSVIHDSTEADIAFNASRRSDAGKYVSPPAFRQTLPSSPAAQLSIALGLGGPMVVFCGDVDGAQALAGACRWLESGAIHTAVVVHPRSGQTAMTPSL